jgi:hypothetical protein
VSPKDESAGAPQFGASAVPFRYDEWSAWMKRGLLCLIACLALSGNAAAQTKPDSAARFTSTGVVRDTVGMPLAAAEVSAEGLSTLSDKKGEFTLRELPTGTVHSFGS